VDPFAGESDGGDFEVATGTEAGAGVEAEAGAATGMGPGLDGCSVGAAPGAPWPEGWLPPEPGCDAGGAAARCDPESPEPAGSVVGGPDRVSLEVAFAASVATVAARTAAAGRAATVPSSTRSMGRPGIGLVRTSGQPWCEMNATSPRPTAVVKPSRANVVLRILSIRLSPATLGLATSRDSCCPGLESTSTTIGQNPGDR
jgi:hypothetical protein